MVQTYIPLDNIITVNNNVLSTSSSGFIPQGLMLTKNSLIPTGAIIPFANATAVGAYFGTISGPFSEYNNAVNYFNSWLGTTTLPPSILIARYTDAATAPYTRGASLSNADFANLKTVTNGTLSVTFNGIVGVISNINLSTANSFSAMAAIIQTKLQASPIGSSASCTFDGGISAFTISNGVNNNSVDYVVNNSGSGDNLGTYMRITQATGAILSQGTPAMTPQQNMNNIIAQTGNFVGFTNNFDTSSDINFSTVMALTSWANSQNNKYIFFSWSLDPNLLITPQSTSTVAYYLANNGYGTIAPTGQITFSAPIYLNASSVDFVCAQLGALASINYNAANSVVGLANKTYSGITPIVNNQIQYNAAILNGCAFYGSFASRANTFNLTANPVLGGIFQRPTNLYNQAWLADAVQTSEITYLNKTPNPTFTDLTAIKGVILDVLNQGLINGVIQAGNTFSAQTAAALKLQAGVDITSNLTNNGYYLQVIAPPPSQATLRTLTVNIWYSNGGNIEKITNNLTYVIS